MGIIKVIKSCFFFIKDDLMFLGNKVITDSEGLLKLDLSEPKKINKTYSFVEVLNRNRGEMDFQNEIAIIYLENPKVRSIESGYKGLHNNAEILADSINTLLK